MRGFFFRGQSMRGRFVTLARGFVAASLALCTVGAAEALGWSGEIGALERGGWGDCVILRPPPSGLAPEERALACAPGDVVATYLGGRAVYRTRTAS